MGDEIPTFSGGLGVLAGDFLRSASDLGLPAVGVTLLYHQGFFRQELDEAGRQIEHPVRWTPADHLQRLDARVKVAIGDRSVVVGAWRRLLTGVGGSTVPVYFLDTMLPENDPADQAITDRLYTAVPVKRLSQEAVLGLAGPAMLRELGHEEIATFHLNEGHASLVPVALLSDRLDGMVAGASPADIAGGPGPLRLHYPHTGSGRPRPFRSRGHGTRPRTRAGRGAGCDRLPRGRIPQHDRARDVLFPLHQRGGPASRGGLPGHVPPVPDRRHHQRRARCLPGRPRAPPGSSTGTCPIGAGTTP